MDLYGVLNVNYDADSRDIKLAYHKLAKIYHPDKHNNDPTLTQTFLDINTAYDILSDKDKRAKYDSVRDKHDLLSLFMNLWNEIPLYSTETMPYIKYIAFDVIDRYTTPFVQITINNKTYDIPTFEHIYSPNNEIMFLIYHKKSHNYTINANDIVIVQSVNLYNYIYGGSSVVKMPNDSYIEFEYESCLERRPMYVFNNCGLYKNENERGDLIIYITIDGINDILDNEMDLEYRHVTKELLNLIFTDV